MTTRGHIIFAGTEFVRDWKMKESGLWQHRFVDSPLELNSLRDKVTISIPDMNKNGWDTQVPIKAKTKSPWREISRVMLSFGQQLGVQVGNGVKTNFWSSRWIEFCQLALKHPRILSLTTTKESSRFWRPGFSVG